MLINCPRCGFSQPQDQYCAQCGVDMQAFKPKKKPLWENPLLQIAVIVVIAALLVKNIMGNSATSLLGKRAQHSQGFTRSEKKSGTGDSESANESEYSSPSAVISDEPDSTKGKNSRDSAAATTGEKSKASAGLTAPGSALGDKESGKAPANAVTFKLTYAEVSNDIVNKWTFDSNNLGFFQQLPEYSVGILHDFKKRGDNYKQTLKTADMNVLPGSGAVNLSGIMTDDGSALIGFAASVELKSVDADGLHGSIVVTKNSRQGTENFPSEFELPKGAAFFILGALKTENFISERAKLQMPPFQIFKAPDFMTHKTEFVIILEPDYK